MSTSDSEPRIDQTIDRVRRRVTTTLYGAVTADQVEEYLRTRGEDPEYDRDYDAIVDLRHFTPTISGEDLQRIALFVRQNPGHPGARRAVLVSNEQTMTITRMFESLTFLSPVIYRAFQSEEAAEAWLKERHLNRKETD